MNHTLITWSLEREWILISHTTMCRNYIITVYIIQFIWHFDVWKYSRWSVLRWQWMPLIHCISSSTLKNNNLVQQFPSLSRTINNHDYLDMETRCWHPGAGINTVPVPNLSQAELTPKVVCQINMHISPQWGGKCLRAGICEKVWCVLNTTALF